MDEFLENYEQARLNYVGCIISPEFSDTYKFQFEIFMKNFMITFAKC